MQLLVQTEFYMLTLVVYFTTYILLNLQLHLQVHLARLTDQPTVTITFSSVHNISAQDIILLDNFSSITNSNFSASDFDDKKFMVTTVPTSTTLTITMPSNESGSGATTSGGIRVQHYYPVGPAVQAKGFGWSLGSWGGEVAGESNNHFTKWY